MLSCQRRPLNRIRPTTTQQRRLSVVGPVVGLEIVSCGRLFLLHHYFYSSSPLPPTLFDLSISRLFCILFPRDIAVPIITIPRTTASLLNTASALCFGVNPTMIV